MKRCVIVGAADINNYDRIKEQLEPQDFFIFCDGGLRHKSALEARADLIVGDFDSFEKPDCDIETIVLPCEKDDTDTVFAAKEAVMRGFNSVLLIGAVGGRLDHTLGNMSILLKLDSLGIEARIIDDFSEMEIVSDKEAEISDDYSFFSLLNISGKAEGITVKNAKYPLDNARIESEYQYGISNEVPEGKTASVSVKEGKLLLIKVY